MYLVHIALAASGEDAVFPAHAAELIGSAALPEERVEHVAVHRRPSGKPVIGIYILAEWLEVAESRAEGVCRRALGAFPELGDWRVLSAGVPLAAPVYDDLCPLPAPVDTSGQGRFRPVEIPSDPV
ncbi:hypothetical protein [Streptomyces sp. NPDC058157]|uniref:hypothetical protein n=1 Tax=Streptomyces sp. NPDC058157 TaxID=3346360 RepID=UPI0036E6C827